MKRIFLLMLFASVMFSCIRVNEGPKPQVIQSVYSETEGLFLHVTKGPDNAHEVLMALSMAAKFAPDYDVLIYFDIDGIEMVTKDAPDLEMEPFGSSDELFSQLIDQGVTLFACPGCMKVHNVKASDLRTGVRIAEKDQFFDFTEGRILSIDY